MASPPSSEPRGPVRVWSADRRELCAEGLCEWEPATLELPLRAAELDSASLDVNGVEFPLSTRRLGGSVRVTADWPRRGAGRYRLVLRVGAAVVHTEDFVVRATKLAETEIATLIEDLERRLPFSVALALHRAGALAGADEVDFRELTVADELERLREALHGTRPKRGLIAVLAELAQRHRTILEEVIVWQPRERARRASATHARLAATRPHNVDAEELPVRIADARILPTANVYENRLVAAVVAQVRWRARRLLATNAASEAARGEARDLLHSLEVAVRGVAFLAEVLPLSDGDVKLTVPLLKTPAYRHSLEVLLALQRGVGVRFEEPALAAPLNALDHLYELWNTLNVLERFVATAVTAGFRVVEQQVIARDSLGFVLRPVPKGTPSVTLEHPTSHAIASFTAQRSYRPGAPGLRSATYEQLPDIAVEVFVPGTSPRVFVFDPKYKAHVPRNGAVNDRVPLKDDIDKMHAYRDAIRSHSGERIVAYAATLYPGPTIRFDDGIAAIGSRPGNASSFDEAGEILLGALREAGTSI